MKSLTRYLKHLGDLNFCDRKTAVAYTCVLQHMDHHTCRSSQQTNRNVCYRMPLWLVWLHRNLIYMPCLLHYLAYIEFHRQSVHILLVIFKYDFQSDKTVCHLQIYHFLGSFRNLHFHKLLQSLNNNEIFFSIFS